MENQRKDGSEHKVKKKKSFQLQLKESEILAYFVLFFFSRPFDCSTGMYGDLRKTQRNKNREVGSSSILSFEKHSEHKNKHTNTHI